MNIDETTLLSIMNSTPDAVIWFNQDQRILLFNSGASAIFQYPESEALAMQVCNLFSVESRAQYKRFFQDFFDSPGSPTIKEIEGIKKNGEKFPTEASFGRSMANGELVFIAILRDISGRKMASEVLQNSESRYRGLVESQTDLIVRVDLEGRFSFINQVYCDTFGKTQEELLGKSFTPLVHPDDLEPTLEAMKRLYLPPYRISVEQRALTVNGWRWFTWEDAIIHDPAGNMVEIQAVGRDITESKQNKQLLIAQRDLAQKLAGTASMQAALSICFSQILLESGMDCGGIYLVDPHTSDLSLAYSQGLSEAFVRAASTYKAGSDRWHLVMQGQIIHGHFKEMPIKNRQDLDMEGLRGLTIIPIFHQARVIGCFNLASHTLDRIIPSGQLAAEAIALQMGGTIIRLLTEETLAESREELEILFNSINDFLVVFDQSGKIVKINHQVTDLLGYTESELLGQPVLKLHPEDIHSQATYILTEMLEGRMDTCPLELISSSGRRIPVETKVSAGKIRGKSVWIGISRDITERKEADLSLRKSKEQLALAIEGSNVGMWDWMLQTGVLILNERWAGIVGYTLEEISPTTIQTWLDFCHPDDLEMSKKLLQDHFDGKTASYDCELRMHHKDGRWVWVLDRGRITERDQDGKPIRMTGTHLDITQRRSMEEKLRRRLEFENLLTRVSTRFINLDTTAIDKEITNALQDIGNFESIDRSYIFLFDYTTKTMSNSHEWCAPGIEPQIDMLQSLPLDIFPWWISRLEKGEPIVVTRVSDMTDEASAEKEILQSQSILSVAVVPLFMNNLLSGFAGFDSVKVEKSWEQDSIALLHQFCNILSNLIERKRVEKALRQSEERNSAILKAIPDNIFRISKDGNIIDFIVADHDSLLLPVEQIAGAVLSDFLGSELYEIALEKIQSAISTAQIQTMNYHIPMKNKTEHFETRFVASGSSEVFAIVRNVSERAHLEQMKSDFINRATHDLRTPLTTILLMVRLLEEECTPEERQEFWNIMKDELERERVLIEDLLTVGRLESNQWMVKLHPINPFQSLQNSIQTISPQALQKNIQIQMDNVPETFSVIGDSSSLEQVFTNLLNNAVKFTPPGGKIEISSYQIGRKGYFKISDTGIGIPAEDIPHLYARFFRARNATDNEIPGSGIGLFIVKSMIEHFGGRIALASELGKGTTVEFWLPLASHLRQN